jgi:hypothetical protein
MQLVAMVGNPPWPISQTTFYMSDACNAAATYETKVEVATTAGPSTVTSNLLSNIETYVAQVAQVAKQLVDVTTSGTPPNIQYTIIIKSQDSLGASAAFSQLSSQLSTSQDAASFLNTASGSGSGQSYAVSAPPVHTVQPTA